MSTAKPGNRRPQMGPAGMRSGWGRGRLLGYAGTGDQPLRAAQQAANATTYAR